MISRGEVDKLLSTRAADPAVLSLYVNVPLDPAALRGLPARTDDLIAAAVRGRSEGGGAIRVRERDRQAVRDLLEQHARDWLGHTVAIFACGQLGLSEGLALPCGLAERAVIATRPHVRPLLVALQRCPVYHAAIVDRRHAWVFKVAAEQIETVAEPVGESVRSPGFSGWYGLEAHRINERVIQLARHHYRETAAILERGMGSGEQPLVLGGHEESIPQFLAMLPPGLRDWFAGSFVADPHRMTPARVRELAAPVVGRWVSAREQRLVTGLLQLPPDRLARGMDACASAVNQHAVRLLVVPDEGLVPGFSCQQCGALATGRGNCALCGGTTRPVPDVIEEMVVKTIEDGGQVEAAGVAPGEIMARLRFQVTPAESS